MSGHTIGLGGYLDLFWQADVVVKSVMIGLLASSVLSWAVIIERTAALSWAMRNDRRFIARYRRSGLPADSPSTAARLFTEMSREAEGYCWNSLLRECVEGRLKLILSEVQRKRRSGLTFLATLASAGPFVGLFGTVWGIMSSFNAIGQSQNTSLVVVAPGIAEALLATGIGLFAAIPAAVFFNRLTASVNASISLLDELGREIMIGFTREAARREAA